MAENKEEQKVWKIVTVKKEDKHNDLALINGIEDKLNEIAKSGYEPVMVQELSRFGATPFIAIIAKLPTNK